MTEGCVKHYKLARINSALNGGISPFSHKALDQQNKLNLLFNFSHGHMYSVSRTLTGLDRSRTVQVDNIIPYSVFFFSLFIIQVPDLSFDC